MAVTDPDRVEAEAIAEARASHRESSAELTRRTRRFVLAARERAEPALLRELAELLGVGEDRVQRIEAAARLQRARGDL